MPFHNMLCDAYKKHEIAFKPVTIKPLLSFLNLLSGKSFKAVCGNQKLFENLKVYEEIKEISRNFQEDLLKLLKVLFTSTIESF